MEKQINEANANYLYSVGMAGFARLNIDGSLPTPNAWEFKNAKGKKIQHTGGLLGKADALDADVLGDTTRNKIYLPLNVMLQNSR